MSDTNVTDSNMFFEDIQSAKDLVEKLIEGIELDPKCGQIHVYPPLGERKLCDVLYIDGDANLFLGQFDEEAHTFAPSPDLESIKYMIHENFKERGEVIEGADPANPGKNLQEELYKEAAESEKENLDAGMDVKTADENFVKAETKAFSSPDRQQLKEEVAKLKSELDKLVDKAGYEVAIMKAQGGNPLEADKISDMVKGINDKTLEIKQAQSRLRTDTRKTVAKGISEKIKSIGHGIKSLGDRMVNSGKQAIAKITDTVRLSNERAAAGVESAYTHTLHNVTQIHRNWAHLNYSLEKAQVKLIDSLQKHLIKSYSKNVYRTAAKKNIKRDLKQLFTGRKQEPVAESKPTLTPKQMDTLNALAQRRDEINKDAETYFAAYAKSAVKDLSRLSQTKEKRDNLGMSKYQNLEADIKRINDQMKKDAANRSANKDMSKDVSKAAETHNTDDRGR